MHRAAADERPTGLVRATSRPMLTPISRDHLAVLAPAAAVRLLGALLVRTEADGSQTVARIVETEAYREGDPASHSVRRTGRSEPMFWTPGIAYVYRSYGVHWCLNVSAEPAGRGAAVLVRAAELLSGHEHVRRRRRAGVDDHALLRGPGCLTAGLDVEGVTHDRRDLLTGEAGLLLADDATRPPVRDILAGPRVGISRGLDLPWRYLLGGSPAVSAYRAGRIARKLA